RLQYDRLVRQRVATAGTRRQVQLEQIVRGDDAIKRTFLPLFLAKLLAHEADDAFPRALGHARHHPAVGNDLDGVVAQQHVDQYAGAAFGIPHLQVGEYAFGALAHVTAADQIACGQARLDRETDLAVVFHFARRDRRLDFLHRRGRKCPARRRMEPVPQPTNRIHHQLPEAPPPPVEPPPPENPPPPPTPPPPNPPPPNPPQPPEPPRRAKVPPVPPTRPISNPTMPSPSPSGHKPLNNHANTPVAPPTSPARGIRGMRAKSPRAHTITIHATTRPVNQSCPCTTPPPLRCGPCSGGGNGSPSTSFVSAPIASSRPP